MTNKPLRDRPPANDASPAPAPAAIDFKMLAESTSDVIIRCGLDGIASYVSPAIQQVLGLAPEELIGKSHRDLIIAEDKPIVAAAVAGYLVGRPTGFLTYRMRRKDGRIVWIEANARSLPDAVTGDTDLVIVLRDITERKALEAKLAMLALTAASPAPAAGDTRDAGPAVKPGSRSKTSRVFN